MRCKLLAASHAVFYFRSCDSGLSNRSCNIPPVEKSNGKPGRGDLVVKDAHLGGFGALVDRRCLYDPARDWNASSGGKKPEVTKTLG